MKLVLSYPISANRYWATRSFGNRAMTYVTAEAKAFKKEVGYLALAAGVVTPITGRVHLRVWLYAKRPLDWVKRARKDPDNWSDTVQSIDLGNCEKVLSDALNGIAWVDDKQIHHIELFKMEPDEHGARCVVEFNEIVRDRLL